MADFILVYKALTKRNYFLKIFIQVLYFFCQNMLAPSLVKCLAKVRDIEYNIMGHSKGGNQKPESRVQKPDMAAL